MDLLISIDRNSPIPLYHQLAEELRLCVLQRRLKANQKLPSSRVLAKALEISRTTVTQSYEQLFSEGYLETRRGCGTYVCAELPEDSLFPEAVKQNINAPSLTMLSGFGYDLLSLKQMKVAEPNQEISFRFGSPSVEHFSMDLWRRLLSRHCRNTPNLLNYAADALGYFPLREAISDYLGRSRGVHCTPEQVVIVGGSQQALDLIARLTINQGDWVAVEDPGYLGARHCFRSYGANLKPIPVDSQGIEVELLTQVSQKLKLLYVTPSHQFPTGALLSLSRRLALLQWAQERGTLIVEDDYDSEYRYGDRPIPALQGLDQSYCVIYVGTFSKILFPSLRIGYLVIPPNWVSLVGKAKWLCDRQSPLLEQYALTDFLNEGHFERHIRRMRQLYNQRRQALVKAIKLYLGDRVTIFGENAGIHLMAKIATTLPDEIVVEKAAFLGLGLISAQDFYLDVAKTGEFIFGYSQLNETQIEQGIQKLAQVLKGN